VSARTRRVTADTCLRPGRGSRGGCPVCRPAMIVLAGYSDTWLAFHAAASGLTWPLYPEDIFAGPSVPTERIDLIFARSLTVLDAEAFGNTSPFPSDHAGVVATLLIEK